MMIKNEFTDMTLPRDKLLGIYRGVVEDNVDPLEAGRVRVRIFGIHTPQKTKTALEGIPTDELLWAEPAYGLIEGSISNYGVWGVPLQGSHVLVFFENGNILRPIYFATLPGGSSSPPTDTLHGFVDPSGTYPDKTGPDFDKGLGIYPHNVVFHVHGGHVIEVDSTPNAKRIRVYHSAGTYIIIDNEGNIEINGVKNRSKTIAENETININGNKNETVSGNVTEGFQSDQQTTVGGNLQITVSGNCTINVTGSCDITGNPINLN
ncbi:MAG TPA: phage baseplate assembly protein V [Bacteroidales bacterium]|nr:phage baseplate assembly protein V [Bacteroidales bacterium]